MRELKRCPFCGDEVEVVATGLYHWKYAIHHKNKTECILDANAFALPYEEEDAVRMWNTRADHKTESNSEIPNNCEYAENPSGDVWECGCFLDTYCEHQIYDRNPDGTINIVECGYESKDEPTSSKMEQVDEPQTERIRKCIDCRFVSECRYTNPDSVICERFWQKERSE